MDDITRQFAARQIEQHRAQLTVDAQRLADSTRIFADSIGPGRLHVGHASSIAQAALQLVQAAVKLDAITETIGYLVPEPTAGPDSN